MPMMPPTFRAFGRATRAEQRRAADSRRGSARERGYTTRWDKASKSHLERDPLCIYCLMGAWGAPSRTEAATLVDHLIPHRGDQAVFWNRADWVSCCGTCHDGPKQSIERRPEQLQAFANAVRAFLAARRGGGSKI